MYCMEVTLGPAVFLSMRYGHESSPSQLPPLYLNRKGWVGARDTGLNSVVKRRQET
jgi:hypothetical protein